MFSLKRNVEQAITINANNHLLVLNILSIKYSAHDVKCDINYCVYTLRRPTHRVSATENHRIFNTRSSAKSQTV